MGLEKNNIEKNKNEEFIYATILDGIDNSWSKVEKAKYIYDQICKVSSYDERIIYSNNPELINYVYNRNVNVDIPMETKLVCKTLNKIYAELLNRVGIYSKIISKPSDINKNIELEDIALIFYDEEGKKYFTNVAADLQRSKYGMKTQFFGGCDENYTDGKREKVTIIKADELKNIDIKTGHLKENEMYSDVVFDMIAKEVKQNNEFKKTLLELPHIVREYLANNGVENSDDMSDDELKEYIKNFKMSDIMQIKMMLIKYFKFSDNSYGPIEQKKHSISLFNSFFNKTEKKYFSTFDMIKENDDSVEIISIIKVNLHGEYLYYKYSEKTKQYELLPIEEAYKISKEYNSKNGKDLIRE